MFSKVYPALAKYINDGWGWIEIGNDEESDSMVRMLDEGGLIWESSAKLQSLNRALQSAEDFIADLMEAIASPGAFASTR